MPPKLLASLASLTALTALVVVPSVLAAPADASRAPADNPVQMRITDVSRSVPPRSTTPTPLQFRITLTNTTDTELRDVRVLGFRGDPIGNQGQLDQSIADRTPPTDGYPIRPSTAVRVDLPPGVTVSSAFTTTISILSDNGGLCQCQNSVYPVYLTATTSDGGRVLGSSATYVPSQVETATKTKVSWVWPLLDRPHRNVADTVFVDDELATSVAGGRLDRVLQVLELVDPTIPMTVVADPELLDELQVMATTAYTVRTTDGNVRGIGTAAAKAWLQRFGALLVTHPAIHLSLTPYADPDIQSLAGEGLRWATTLPTTMKQRVITALQGRPVATDVAWPAAGALGRTALDVTAASGAKTVVVDGAALSPATSGGDPVSLARLRAAGGSITAVATSATMQQQVAQAVTTEAPATSGATVLPRLVAETTIRSVAADDKPSYAVLTPPRYVDPAPARATHAIEDTSNNGYATPVDVRALAADRPSTASKLRPSATAAGRTELPDANLRATELTSESLPPLTSMLTRDTDARSLLVGLGRGAQRTSSSAWRPVSGSSGSPFSASLANAFATGLRNRVQQLLDGVRIFPPSSGSYTLGSKDSSLPITVENRLPYGVEVRLEVSAQDQLPGFTMRPLATQRIAANAKETVQVPSELGRSGRIAVAAQLKTPSGIDLGGPVQLFVRSTVFGTIGIVITVVAGGVLVIALLVRFGRRLRRRRRKTTDEGTGRHTRRTTAGTAAS